MQYLPCFDLNRQKSGIVRVPYPLKATVVASSALVLALLLAAGCSPDETSAGASEIVPLHADASPTAAEVNFLTSAPVVDGVLDEALENLPVRHFTHIRNEDSDPVVDTHFRLAYGIDFFYLYVEGQTERFTYRDRSYQFGDGFMMILATPEPDGTTAGEYYEIACGVKADDSTSEFPEVFLSALNLNRIFLEIGTDTLFDYAEINGRSAFELLIPWKNLRPHHPLSSDSIGFNLLFTKATPGDETGSVRYYAVPEERVPFTKRAYSTLRFQQPDPGNLNTPQVNLCLNEGHVGRGIGPSFTLNALSPDPMVDRMEIEILNGDGTVVFRTHQPVDYRRGVTRSSFSIQSDLDPGSDYSVRWGSGAAPSSTGRQALVVLPEFDESQLRETIERANGTVSTHAIDTYEFQIEELKTALDSLRVYEDGQAEYVRMTRLLDSSASLSNQIDPCEGKRGFIRKAYRSSFDDSLQPYVVYLPEDYDASSNYPLFVFLHGSEMTEVSITGARILIPDGFIGLGPLGRGTSNAYTFDDSQVDIAESIDAVVDQYSIDEERILVAGFSMGGYGALRSQLETPERYRALALFSGGPDMGAYYAEGRPSPNFLDEQNPAVFQGTPIFVHHGEKDLNAPFTLTRDLVSKLQEAGAEVEFIADPDRGHEGPSKANLALFHEWAQEVVRER